MKKLLQVMRGVEAEQLYQHCTTGDTASVSRGGALAWRVWLLINTTTELLSLTKAISIPKSCE